MDESPYRGKPLADIIPPDRRRWKVIGLVAASMVAGIGLWELGKTALDAMHTEVATPITSKAQPLPPGFVSPVVLQGPDGRRIALPTAEKVVVNVWLQGCGDCMPAFEAARKLEDDDGGLGVDNLIVNVAYGSATTEWASKYGVAKNLVFDPGGSKIVKPLGIGTFTSLVIDPNGTVIHRDRPDRPGYRDRMRAALGVKAAHPVPDEPGFDHSAVERVVRSHTAEVKRACWDGRDDTGPATANTTVVVRVAADGSVDSTQATGDNPLVSACLERVVKKWSFPAPGSPTTVNIPFKFVRQ